MRAFLMLYARDFENDDIDKDHHRYRSGKSRRSEWRAFTVLSSVCSYWHLTLTGWPELPTGHWVRHKLRKLIECESISQSTGLYLSCIDNDMQV